MDALPPQERQVARDELLGPVLEVEVVLGVDDVEQDGFDLVLSGDEDGGSGGVGGGGGVKEVDDVFGDVVDGGGGAAALGRDDAEGGPEGDEVNCGLGEGA